MHPVSRARAGRLALALSIGTALVVADSAAACSCAGGLTPREKLADAKAAFVGRVVKKRDVTPKPNGEYTQPGKVFRYRIRVGHSYKRRLGRFIKIKASNEDATCGFEWRRRQRVAAYLYGRRGNWRAGLCTLERPKTLLRAARRGELGLAAAKRGNACGPTLAF
jgi:hypothetical protein